MENRTPRNKFILNEYQTTFPSFSLPDLIFIEKEGRSRLAGEGKMALGLCGGVQKRNTADMIGNGRKGRSDWKVTEGPKGIEQRWGKNEKKREKGEVRRGGGGGGIDWQIEARVSGKPIWSFLLRK